MQIKYRKIEDRYKFEYAKFLNIMGDLRKKISSKIRDKKKREEIYNKLVDSDIINLIRDGNNKSAKNRIDEIIKSYNL